MIENGLNTTISLEELEADKSPRILKSFGGINIYSITKLNFEKIVKNILEIYEQIKDKDLKNAEVQKLQLAFIKKIFPIMTNIDMTNATDVKIKKILQNPSTDLEETLVFLFKYLINFMDDFHNYNERISGLPKKEFDLLEKSTNQKEVIDIFERNNLLEDEIIKDFTEKYLK